MVRLDLMNMLGGSSPGTRRDHPLWPRGRVLCAGGLIVLECQEFFGITGFCNYVYIYILSYLFNNKVKNNNNN